MMSSVSIKIMNTNCHYVCCLSTRICLVLIPVMVIGLLSREPVELRDTPVELWDPPLTSPGPHMDKPKAKQNYDTCAAIFNIGQGGDLVDNEGSYGLVVPGARKIVEDIRQAKEEGIIDDERHRRLTTLLPHFVKDNTTLPPDLANVPPRLSLLQGRVPYLPCRLQEVDKQFMQTCILRRTQRRLNTWIAFVGDSKMREKFEYFLTSTRHFDWNITVSEAREWRVVDYKEAVKLLDWKWHDSVDAVSLRQPGVRLSLVWDSHVIYTLPYGNRVVELFKWAYTDVPVPSVVVIGTGTWILTQTYIAVKNSSEKSGAFESADNVIDRWRRARPLLKALASKTLILLWTQSRFREHIETIEEDIARTNADLKQKKHLYYKDFRMGHMNLIDMAMWHAGRGTGAVLWDSSMPFNLANIEECRVVGQSLKLGAKSPGFYHSPWWSCEDVHHSSDNTHHAEATMLWNYLCNQIVSPAQNVQEYCCT